MNALFNSPALFVLDQRNAFSLATLLASMEWEAPRRYVNRWRAIEGAGAAEVVFHANDNPNPYIVLPHPDGVIVAFLGLRNEEQASSLIWNTQFAECSGQTGKIASAAIRMWAVLRPDILAKVAAAPNRAKILICGHSFGGILAAIAAKTLAGIYGNDKLPYVCTFGTPRLCNPEYRQSMPCPTYCVENSDDYVCEWPEDSYVSSTSTTRKYDVEVASKVGLPVILDSQGVTITTRPWFARAFGQLPAWYQAWSAREGLGPTHSPQSYARRLGRQFTNSSPLATSFKLHQLLRAMKAMVDPDEFTETQTPMTTNAAAAPPAPTVAQAQARPTSAMDPTNLGAATFDTDSVGVNQRSTVSATVTSSTHAGAKVRFLGSDRQLIERTYNLIYDVIRRDSRLMSRRRSKGITSRRDQLLLQRLTIKLSEISVRDANVLAFAPGNRYSTQCRIIDPANTALVAAFTAYEAVISARANAAFARTPIIDNSNVTLRGQEHLLLRTLASYLTTESNLATAR